ITDGHRETWPIRSKRFRTWLRRCYYQATGTAAGAAVIGSTLDLLEARAQFDGPERDIAIRVAEHVGRIYLDLADEHWRAIVIGVDGWRLLGCPPVRFRRSPGMLPLPAPERGGSIETLRPFLNLSNQNDFVKNPRALAGHLRRVQTFLRTLGIDITFSREGRSGTRVIR